MEMASINLPGREADFWTWANGPLVTFDNAFDAYMQNLHAKDDMNYALNVRTANAIKLARRFGLAAPIIALLVAACRAVAAI